MAKCFSKVRIILLAAALVAAQAPASFAQKPGGPPAAKPGASSGPAEDAPPRYARYGRWLLGEAGKDGIDTALVYEDRAHDMMIGLVCTDDEDTPVGVIISTGPARLPKKGDAPFTARFDNETATPQIGRPVDADTVALEGPEAEDFVRRMSHAAVARLDFSGEIMNFNLDGSGRAISALASACDLDVGEGLPAAGAPDAGNLPVADWTVGSISGDDGTRLITITAPALQPAGAAADAEPPAVMMIGCLVGPGGAAAVFRLDFESSVFSKADVARSRKARAEFSIDGARPVRVSMEQSGPDSITNVGRRYDAVVKRLAAGNRVNVKVNTVQVSFNLTQLRTAQVELERRCHIKF